MLLSCWSNLCCDDLFSGCHLDNNAGFTELFQWVASVVHGILGGQKSQRKARDTSCLQESPFTVVLCIILMLQYYDWQGSGFVSVPTPPILPSPSPSSPTLSIEAPPHLCFLSKLLSIVNSWCWLHYIFVCIFGCKSSQYVIVPIATYMEIVYCLMNIWASNHVVWA